MRIFEDLAGDNENCRPHLIADDSGREISEVDLDGWREADCSTADSGYRTVIGDGPDVSDSSDEGNRPD
jgi:hypothetical protein